MKAQNIYVDGIIYIILCYSVWR